MDPKIKILLVDDYPANLVALGAVLSDPMYQLIEATSGPEALEIASTTDIALILLDIQMPGMDGYEVARQVRSNPRSRHIPIIFITAIYREEPAVRKGYAAGGQDYLGKPFDPEVLRAKVGIYSHLFQQKLQLERESLRLKESEEHYRMIVEGAQEIIATIDEGGVVTSLNLAFERLTGLKCSDWIGKPLHPLLDSDDLDAVLARFAGNKSGSSRQLCRVNMRTSGNHVIPMEISIQQLAAQGRKRGVVGVMRDVSSREAS